MEVDVTIGVVGTAGNALILYALVASEQHNCYALKLSNLRLSGTFGYWLCITLISESLVWLGTNGSLVNLAAVTVDRYLKVVHPVWSKKLRRWMIYLAMAFSWFAGIVYNMTLAFETSAVVDGVCYSFVFESDTNRKACSVFYVSLFYVMILVVFIFCYGHILIVIRRQASVVADHSATDAGLSTIQAQMNWVQTSVIKTMILVCALYAVTRLPSGVYMIVVTSDPNPSMLIDARFYASVFLSFLYTTANPFIYATNFDPVKQILKGMIPCEKTSVQATA